MIEFDPTLVHDWLSRSARRTPDKEALVSGLQRWTYREIDSCSNRFAEALVELGVRRQDRVVVLLGNCPETVVCLYGVLKVGGVFVVLDGTTKVRRLRYVLENSGARLLVATSSQVNKIQEALEGLGNTPKVIYLEPEKATAGCVATTPTNCDSIFSATPCGDGDTYMVPSGKLPRCIDADLACLVYTSASTGEPKGVMCSHHNMIAAARSIIQYIGSSENDIILNALPLSFDYGLYQVIMAFMFGGTVVLENSFLYLHNILTRISQERVTGFPVMPTMVALLLRMHDIEKYELSTLRYITNTGASLPVKHIHYLQRLLPHVKIFSMFGLTECKRVSYLLPEEIDRRPSSVGQAMSDCEVFLVDENGNRVARGDVGELVIRGSNVMQGYWRDPELTVKVFQPGSYPAVRELHSGDYFREDEEGFLYFVGRRDDMVKTRGQRVSPKEVESAICGLRGVLEVAVVGVPDEILGQAIKAFVVQTDTELTEKDVRKYCSNNLGPLMVPKYIELVSALPRTPHGKVDKRKLQAKEK